MEKPYVLLVAELIYSEVSQIKKLRLFIDLANLQVCFLPFFFQDFEQQHIHCLIYLKL